jgi:hypothetical protein
MVPSVVDVPLFHAVHTVPSFAPIPRPGHPACDAGFAL